MPLKKYYALLFFVLFLYPYCFFPELYSCYSESSTPFFG